MAAGARDVAIRGAQGIVLVYSVHSTATFVRLRLDLAKIFSAFSDLFVPPLMVVGVSVPGQQREVEVEEAKELARSVGAGYCLCSPASSFGVLFALTDLVRRVPERRERRREHTGKLLASNLLTLLVFL